MGRKKLLVLVLALVMVFATFSPAMAAYYNDTAGHWAERDINWATEKGYLKGDGNGYFRPEDTVTRAEYVTGVNRLINSATRATIGYPDVRTSDWFYDEMAKGVYNGIIDDSRYNFRPNEAITRDEAARIVARAYRLTNYADAATIFKDYNSIANKGEVGALATKKVINGWPDGNYYPNKTLTRAEYSKILRASVENLGLPSKPTAPVATVPSDWWAGYPGYGYGYGYNCELELSKLLSAINSGERYLLQTDVYTADSLATLRKAVEAGRTTYNTYKNYKSDYRYGYYGYDLKPWNYTSFYDFERAVNRSYPGVYTTSQLRDIYDNYKDGRYYDDYYGYYGINPNSYNSLESFRRAMKDAYGSRVTDSEIERIYRDRANYRYYDRDRYPYYYYDTCPYQATIDAATKRINDAINGLVKQSAVQYNITYKFVKADGVEKELPTEVMNLKPAATKAVKGSTVTPTVPAKETIIILGTDKWTFEGYIPEKVTNISKDQEFVGTWKYEKVEPEPVEKVTVTFDANEGTGTMDSVKVDKGSEYELPENTFTAPEGKEFKAWGVDEEEKAVGDKITVNADVTVKAIWQEKTVPVESVTVAPGTKEIEVDKTVQLEATVNPDNATNKNVTWKSSNAEVATVDANGLVTGKTASDTPIEITVTTEDGNKTAVAKITVKAKTVPQ